ncbi:MAG: CheR family methyltransferase [Anaerolineae bacterium]
MSHNSAKLELSYHDYLRFRELVRERSGLHFPEKKWPDLEIGIFKALAESPLRLNSNGHNLDEYFHLLSDKNHPTGRAEMDRLIKMLTIGETHFFRDKAQFDALTQHVLPDLIARKRAAAAAVGRGTAPQLRIWSAGCATGEEAYSVALVLKELLPDLENWQILILATDINPDALARAREGLYSDWSFRENRAKALLPYYFSPETPQPPRQVARYRLHPHIRSMVTFASLNLVEDNFPAIHNNTLSMDLILCRNVTIYFAEEATRQVIKQFYNSLVEGGWLVVGHSEPSMLVYQAFQLHSFPDTFLYQKAGHSHARSTNWGWFDRVKKATGSLRSHFLPTNPATSQNLDIAPTRPMRETASARVDSAYQPPVIFDPYQQAQTLLQVGRVQEAIVQLKQKLDIEPNSAPAYSLLGLAYANLGQWDEARQWCQHALKMDGLLAEAYFVLGLVAQNQSDPELAIGMMKKAIYLNQFEPLFHFHLGTLYHQQNQIELAQRTYQNAIRILKKWSGDHIVPYSGGATAKYLLETIQRIWAE